MKRGLFVIFLLLAIATITFFSACEEDEIETLPLQTVNGEIFETVDYGTKLFVFEFRTDTETYPVTYLIRYESNVENKQVNINLLDIQKDGHDDLNIKKGPASCAISLGALDNGEYDLQIDAGNYSGTGTFTISDDLVTLDFAETEGITMTNDTLHRIPFGTVWGYVGYNNSSNASLANSFVSNLNALGAEQAQLSPGYYGYFSVSDSGDIIQSIDNQYAYYKEFFKQYNGEAAALDEHVKYYTTEHYNKVDLIFHWFWDGELKSQVMHIPGERY